MNQQVEAAPTPATHNPMADLARLYTVIERVLRGAQINHLTIGEIYTIREIRDAAKNLDQVKRVISELQRKEFVNAEGKTANRRYWWNLEAPPFLLGVKTAQKAVTQPSTVAVTKPMPQPLEVVFNGVMLTISRRENGALRVQIDDTL